MRIEPRDRHDERQLEEGLENLFIPLHMRDGIRSYVLDHLPVGGFLTAVIQNDLSAAASAARTRCWWLTILVIAKRSLNHFQL